MDVKRAAALGAGLLAEHGLAEWHLVFDNARTRFGVCRPRRREIGLSRRLTLLSSAEQVRNTVLHEIAHALVGPQHGHDAVWRAKAVEIGSDGKRTDAVPEGAEGSWEGRCAAGHTVRRHRRPRRVGSCLVCSRDFDLGAIYSWTHQGGPAPMLPAYEAELAQLRRRYGAAAS
ncbi:MAG: SprT-like domain-containing protein [Ornithinimicrobium sp.]